MASNDLLSEVIEIFYWKFLFTNFLEIWNFDPNCDNGNVSIIFLHLAVNESEDQLLSAPVTFRDFFVDPETFRPEVKNLWS